MNLQIIKSFDTFFIAGWYFISGSILSKFVDNIFPEFDEINYSKKYTLVILIEIIVSLWIFLLISRIIRITFVDFLYSPFENFLGYKRQLTKESTGGVIFAFSLFNYANNLKNKISYFGKRLGY